MIKKTNWTNKQRTFGLGGSGTHSISVLNKFFF